MMYVYILNLFLKTMFSGSTKRLTFAHKGGRCLSDDPLAAGVPSYVMQEEFNRYHGYWWQPKKHTGKYLLLKCSCVDTVKPLFMDTSKFSGINIYIGNVNNNL